MIARIAPIIEKLIREDSLFQGLDKNETIEILAPLLEERFSREDSRTMPDYDLIPRIDRVMGGQVLYNLWLPKKPGFWEKRNPVFCRS